MNHACHRGFVTIIALSILALISALSVSLISLTATQQQRTADQQFQAQRRQLLQAGAMAALRWVVNFKPGDEKRTHRINLPRPLAQRKAIINIWVEQTIPNVERIAHVEVSLDDQPQSQSLRYVRDRKGWGLVEAKLGG
jgi:type II secretory pathway component PulK